MVRWLKVVLHHYQSYSQYDSLTEVSTFIFLVTLVASTATCGVLVVSVVVGASANRSTLAAASDCKGSFASRK